MYRKGMETELHLTCLICDKD